MIEKNLRASKAIITAAASGSQYIENGDIGETFASILERAARIALWLADDPVPQTALHAINAAFELAHDCGRYANFTEDRLFARRLNNIEAELIAAVNNWIEA